MHRLAFALILSLALTGLSLASEPSQVTVVFRTGRVVEGELLSYADSLYRVRVADGVLEIPARDVARVEFPVPKQDLLQLQEKTNNVVWAQHRARLEREAQGKFVAIGAGRLLGVRRTMAEARALVAKEAPRALHCLTFQVGAPRPKVVSLGSTSQELNVGLQVLEALKGKFSIRDETADRPAELILSTDLGQVRLRGKGKEFNLPLLFGPADGRLELARPRVSRDFKGALTLPFDLALERGLFRASLPGGVGLDSKPSGKVFLGRSVRVRVAISGLDIDAEFVAHVLPPKAELVATGIWGGAPMKITIDVQDMDLRDVIEVIGKQVGREILVDPSVEEAVTLRLKDVDWQEVVELLAKMTRCDLEERPDGSLLLSQPPRVTIAFHDADVRTIFQLLAAYSGKNVIIGPKVQGTVDLQAKEEHWLTVFRKVADMIGAEVHLETKDLVRVSMPAKTVKPGTKSPEDVAAFRAALAAAREKRDSGDYAAAIKAYEAALKLDPASGAALYERGTCYLKLGNFFPGMQDLARAVGCDPRLGEAVFNKVYQVGYVVDFKRVLAELDRIVRQQPKESHVYFLRGAFYLASAERGAKLADVEAGLADFERCLALQPNHTTALLYQGLLSMQLGERAGDAKERGERLQTALRSFVRAERLDPKSATAHYLQAMWWSFASAEGGLSEAEAKVRRDKAIKELETAFQLGFRGVDRIRSERRLDPIREEPEFKRLLSGR